MKREYIKPYLAVESFQLNAAIAGSCGGAHQIALNHDINECTLVDETGTNYGIIFFGAACGENVVNPNNPDGPCYMEFSDGDVFLTS